MFLLFLICNFILFIDASPIEDLPDKRVIGGQQIDIAYAPYQVSLFNGHYHICGGSIIAPDLILTAAHCVTEVDPTLYIRAGSSSSLNGGQLIQVNKIAYPHNYSEVTLENDIALLLLEKELTFGKRVSSIAMIDEGAEIPRGSVGHLTGWGLFGYGNMASPELIYAKLRIHGVQYCQKVYGSSFKSSMICAGGSGQSACEGDSGAPLVYNGKLVGAVSFGRVAGCDSKYPAVYTKVAAHRPWIRDAERQLRARS